VVGVEVEVDVEVDVLLVDDVGEVVGVVTVLVDVDVLVGSGYSTVAVSGLSVHVAPCTIGVPTPDS
jgi:hypothetical protein